MFLKPETRKQVKGLSDLLDYSAVVADGVVLLSTGLLLAGWEIAGPDMDSLAPGECWQLANRLAGKFQLGQGWTVQCDLIRAEHHEYCPEANWPDPVSYVIEQERKARFALSDEAATRLSRYFLTVSYEPSLRGGRKAAAWMFSSSDGEAEAPLERSVVLFEKRVSELDSFLRSALPRVQRLGTYECVRGGHTQVFDSLMQHVRQCISGEDYPFRLPETPMFLNQYLATDDFTGGAEPQLGDPLNELVPGKRIVVLAIDAFPEQSFAGILRELDSLPWNFRYCQQAQLLDEQEAKEKHQANKNKWGFQKTPALRKLSPIKVGGDQTIDTFAAQMEADAAQAMSAAEHGKEVFVQFSAKVILMEQDAERLKRAAEAVRRVAMHAGFSCRIESIHAVGAWLASFPGQHYKEKRAFLVNTANMVHMMPLSAPFRGREFNPSPFFPAKTPPLFYAVTSGGTPFRFHAHSADVGHQLITGPTGSGKTTWIALGIAQWFRYPRAQVFAFDKRRTLYTLCKGTGGDYYEITPDSRETRLCPLQDLDSARDRNQAEQWIELLLAQNDYRVDHNGRNQIKETLALLSSQRGGRSLTDFHMAVQSKAIKDALQAYLGGILDGERDQISMSRFCVFEMDELYRMDKKTMNGALFYIFGKIRRRLTSNVPTLVTVDEFREALSHPLAAHAFDEFLFEGRKLNMAVWLVLQELSKVFDSPLKNAVLEQCFTKVCLPNPQASLEAATAYEALGMNAQDRELIAHAEPKSHYYVTSPDGKRMISLELGGVGLSFLAASNDRDRALVDALLAREGRAWPATWLRDRGYPDWAELFETLTTAQEAVAYA